jgi:hypothetical protein
MEISTDLALPCGQYLEGSSPARLCGELTTHAVIVPDSDGAWELIPVCSQHLIEASQQLDEPRATTACSSKARVERVSGRSRLRLIDTGTEA